MRPVLAALSFALLAAGCGDPVGEARFVLVDTAGAPVAGAGVVIACPNRPSPAHQVSEPDGKVVYQSIPDIDPGCTFSVEKPGFMTKSLKRADVGYHKGIDDKAAPAKVVLDRAP
jgi:hypothetical protein